MKPHLPWVTLTSTAVVIPMAASTAIRGGATRPGSGHGWALEDLAAGAGGAGRVAGRSASRSLAHPRFARPGPAPSARRTPRPSACLPGSARSGPIRPRHGRNPKPSFQQEDDSPSWRSPGSRLSVSCRRARVWRISNVLNTACRRHCRMPPVRGDICHRPPGARRLVGSLQSCLPMRGQRLSCWVAGRPRWSLLRSGGCGGAWVPCHRRVRVRRDHGRTGRRARRRTGHRHRRWRRGRSLCQAQRASRRHARCPEGCRDCSVIRTSAPDRSVRPRAAGPHGRW